MKTLPPTSRRSAEKGHVLTTAVCILAVMATIAGATMRCVSARYKTAYRNAAWQESLVVAESGVDMTIANIAGMLPDVQLNNQTGLTFATSPLSLGLLSSLQIQPGGLNLSSVATLSLTPDPLTHAGEGATTTSSTVSIDVLPLDQILNGSLISGALGFLTTGTMPSINVIRIRSTGMVYLPGSSREADVSKLDAELHHAVLVTDPQGHTVAKPYVSRQIEVLIKPVFPFQNGVSSDGFLHNADPNTIFDSFSSASALTSTNYLYDTAKRRQNIQVSSNVADVTLAGNVLGDVLTNNGSIVKNSLITGKVNNNYFSAMPSVKAPTFSGTAVASSGSKAIAGGTLLAVNTYKYTNVSGTLHVTGNILSGLGSLLGSVPVVGSVVSSQADIYIQGDFNGKLVVDPGVRVRIYTQGNMTFGPNALQNLTNVAANVQIFGVATNATTKPVMSIDTSGGPVAAIYAPTHAITLAGNGNFSGALTGGSVDITGSADVHFDEALALQTGPVIGYQLVSWKEISVP